MQQLEVNLTIPVPSDMVLIKKIELEELKSNSLQGVYWNMKDLEGKTKRKSEWIKENILFPSRFRKLLDAETGGFVYYPKSKGQTWVFQANKMADFLDKHFRQIFSN
jgi:phage pi2 protein 07